MNFPITQDWSFYLMGIDPGSSCIGVSLYRIHYQTLDIMESFAFTLQAKDSFHYNKGHGEYYGDKYARMRAFENDIYELFQQYRPSMVCCESPFFNRFTPNAYGILVEVLSLIQRTLWRFNSQIPFQTVDPPTAKKAVRAKGNAKKEDMSIALMKMKETIAYQGDLSLLDEHAIDALAIGYYGYLKVLEGARSC